MGTGHGKGAKPVRSASWAGYLQSTGAGLQRRAHAGLRFRAGFHVRIQDQPLWRTLGGRTDETLSRAIGPKGQGSWSIYHQPPPALSSQAPCVQAGRSPLRVPRHRLEGPVLGREGQARRASASAHASYIPRTDASCLGSWGRRHAHVRSLGHRRCPVWHLLHPSLYIHPPPCPPATGMGTPWRSI